MAGVIYMAASFLALGSSVVDAQSSLIGLPQCPCIGDWSWTQTVKNSATMTPYACTEWWAASTSKCVLANVSGSMVNYQEDYGMSCKVHAEPGNTACSIITNVASTTGRPKAAIDKAAWCDDTWCYVDPCNCNAPDVYSSSYFPLSMYYSYSTCGSADEFTGGEGGSGDKEISSCSSSELDGASQLSATIALMVVAIKTLFWA